MKTTTKRLAVLAVSCLAFAAPHVVSAQDKTAPPPPKLEKLEEGPESDIKLIKPETTKLKTVERRENGKVTEVQVRTGKSTYSVKPNAEPKGTPAGDANRAATWKVLEFGGKKETKEVESLPVLPPGPNSTSKIGATKPVAPKVENAKPASMPAEKQ